MSIQIGGKKIFKQTIQIKTQKKGKKGKNQKEVNEPENVAITTKILYLNYSIQNFGGNNLCK
ncbi:MAG: hypothetical protein ACTSVK_05820 [Promethearchaeota archaeon]